MGLAAFNRHRKQIEQAQIEKAEKNAPREQSYPSPAEEKAIEKALAEHDAFLVRAEKDGLDPQLVDMTPAQLKDIIFQIEPAIDTAKIKSTKELIALAMEVEQAIDLAEEDQELAAEIKKETGIAIDQIEIDEAE